MKDLNESLNRATRGVMNFLFPRRCPFCGAVLEKDASCKACEKNLPACRETKTGSGYGRVTAPLYYTGKVRAAILDYKFNGKLGGLQTFGTMMAACAAERYSGEFDAITWVPVSKKRLRKRGYDQAHYLASSVCVDWHVVPQETLRKIRDNQPQSGLTDRKERWANVLGVYEAVNPAEIAGKRFLLIDDIFTTGATLSECVRVLKDAGAQEVMCLTLAITPENETAASGAE